MVERAGYREIFVPLNAGNGSNTGVAIEIARLRGDLRAIAYGKEPIVFVWCAPGLDGDEAGAEACGDRGIRNSGELKLAVAGADAGDGGDDGGGGGAEGFCECP